MHEKSKKASNVRQHKGSNQKPQISGDANELPESELNKVAGGADRVDHGDLKIVKHID